MKFAYPFLLIIACNLSAMNIFLAPTKQIIEHQEKDKIFNNLLFYIRNHDLNNTRDILVYYQDTQQLDELNRYSLRGLPPLYEALTCKSVDAEIVEYLLFYGADPNLKVQRKKVYIRNKGKRRARAFHGWTAAHICARCLIDEKILNLLKKYKTDFIQSDSGGWSPLRVAKKDGNKIAEVFLAQFYPTIQLPLVTMSCEQVTTKKFTLWFSQEDERQIEELILPEHEKEAAPSSAASCIANKVQQELPMEELVVPLAMQMRGIRGDEPYLSILKFSLITGLGLGVYCWIGF